MRAIGIAIVSQNPEIKLIHNEGIPQREFGAGQRARQGEFWQAVQPSHCRCKSVPSASSSSAPPQSRRDAAIIAWGKALLQPRVSKTQPNCALKERCRQMTTDICRTPSAFNPAPVFSWGSAPQAISATALQAAINNKTNGTRTGFGGRCCPDFSAAREATRPPR